MINVLLADDHEIVRHGLSLMLAGTPDIRVIAEAGTGKEVLDLVEGGVQPEVILLDIMMPDLDGLELAEKIQQFHAQIAVVILTIKNDDHSLRTAYQYGARGYLLKSTNPDELTFAIRQAARKQLYLGSAVADRLMQLFEEHNIEEKRQAAQIDFTERELELLRLLGEGYTNQQAADKLFTSKRTIEGYRQAMFNKTGTGNAAQLIRFAMRAGLLH